MAETPADVRRDIELTRERMSSTLAQLEQKMNVMQLVKDHPWPAIGVAVGAGFLLSGSKADVKAAAATAVATRGAGSRMGVVLDDLVANLMTAATTAFQQRVESWVGEIKQAIGAPAAGAQGAVPRSGLAARDNGSAASTPSSGAYDGATAVAPPSNEIGTPAAGEWQPGRAD